MGGPRRVMAARWPRVHLYGSPGPVTKESLRPPPPLPPPSPAGASGDVREREPARSELQPRSRLCGVAGEGGFGGASGGTLRSGKRGSGWRGGGGGGLGLSPGITRG